MTDARSMFEFSQAESAGIKAYPQRKKDTLH